MLLVACILGRKALKLPIQNVCQSTLCVAYLKENNYTKISEPDLLKLAQNLNYGNMEN